MTMKPKQFILSRNSLAKLVGVDTKLVAVVKRAIQITDVDFVVVQGNRTQAQQNELFAQGRTKPGSIVTWTRNSNHIGGRAVDLAPYVNGGIEWDNNGKLHLWPHIAEAMKEAAKELKTNIVWGGDWITTKDRPHFELRRTK